MASDIKWIKVITDIFEDEKIKLIKSMPEGRTLVLIWFQLLIQAGKTNAGGWIYLSEGCGYTPAMLATLFNESQQMVEMALKLFSTKPFELIDMTDDGLIYIPNWEKHQNVESMDKIREKERLRKAKQREKQKLLTSRDSHGTSHGTSHQSHAIEIEKELDLDKEKEINISTTTHGSLATIADVHRIIFRQLQIPPIMTDYISKLLNQGVHENLIMEAMYECGESSANPNKRLLESIIDRWIKEGISSREENRQRKQQEKRPNIPTNRSGQASDRLKNGRPVFTVVSSEREENPLTPEELEELRRMAAKLDGKGEPA